eukprot:Sdes_comp24229_c0_seq1m22232
MSRQNVWTTFVSLTSNNFAVPSHSKYLARCTSKYLYSRSLTTKRASDKDYYLEKSVIPTMHFQKSLPRLPIPQLNSTLEKYLLTVKPLLTASEFETTQKSVDKFRQEEGPKLHQQLLEFDSKNKDTSYLSEVWFDMYLKGREPLPINSNPFMAWRLEENPQKNEQSVKATSLVVSSLKFYHSLRDGILSPDWFETKPSRTQLWLSKKILSLIPSSISYYG